MPNRDYARKNSPTAPMTYMSPIPLFAIHGGRVHRSKHLARRDTESSLPGRREKTRQAGEQMNAASNSQPLADLVVVVRRNEELTSNHVCHSVQMAWVKKIRGQCGHQSRPFLPISALAHALLYN